MREPITRVTCDTPDCGAVTYTVPGQLIHDLEPSWFLGKHGDHCPKHATEERARLWRPFKGPIHGTEGWQSVITSRIVYQPKCPTDPTAAYDDKTASAVEAL